ncbi:4396_t:CDS:2, partial [Dentiscutata erythropus]
KVKIKDDHKEIEVKKTDTEADDNVDNYDKKTSKWDKEPNYTSNNKIWYSCEDWIGLNNSGKTEKKISIRNEKSVKIDSIYRIEAEKDNYKTFTN